MKILELDLNQLVSEEVSTEITKLTEEITELQKDNASLRSLVKRESKIASDLKILTKMSRTLKFRFNEIKHTPKTKDTSAVSKEQNQFKFIGRLMFNIFGISAEYKGWRSGRNDHQVLWANLAVNYYQDKNILLELLEIIMSTRDYNKIKEIINQFQMPYEYSEELITKFIQTPKYNTNGEIFGVSQYWLNAGLREKNLPYDLILSNPICVKENVFNLLLSTLKGKSSNSHFLLAITQYNKEINAKQIEKLGECLIEFPEAWFKYPTVKDFIEKNTIHFNTKTLSYLFDFISHDNQFKLFDWQRFPLHYQKKYLALKDFEEVMKILNDYTCKWSQKEKQDFLRKFLTRN